MLITKGGIKMENLKALETERINCNTVHIDEMDTQEMLFAINAEDQKVAEAVKNAVPDIARAVDAIYASVKKGGRLIYIGAGTSGRLGILDASECPPTYGVSQDLIQGIIAGGEKAIHLAVEGAEDRRELAEEDLKKISLNNKDVVCGLAASGRTPYVIGGLDYAKSIGAATVSICCVQNARISEISDFPIEVIVGPEVVTGSTRMKAGTAQKMVLNMLSTSVMIKCGKVYGNLMVDVRATNQKLVDRAIRILMNVLSCSYEEAEILFVKSGKGVKTAIIMDKCQLTREQSETALGENEGKIKKTLQQYICK